MALIRFMADGFDKEGNMCGWDGKATSEAKFREMLEEDGATLTKVVRASNHHRCMYCGGIAESTYKELLCSQCREDFGHTLITEL